MSDPDDSAGIASVWLRYAATDMAFARFGLGQPEWREMAAFHAQQAIEKALKAMCVATGTDFEKTHDLGRLLGHVRTFDAAFVERWRHLDQVTEYAVMARYPMEVGKPALSPAKAVTLAEEVLPAVECWLAGRREP